MKRGPKKKERGTTNYELFNTYESVKELHSLLPDIKIACVKDGITLNQLTCLKEVIAIDFFTFSVMLGITERTIYMRKGPDTFSHIISDRIMAIALLYSWGYQVFGAQDAFNCYMKMPNRYFKGETPIAMIETVVGYKEVFDEISRFAVGTY